jgi:hypothetical protein
LQAAAEAALGTLETDSTLVTEAEVEVEVVVRVEASMRSGSALSAMQSRLTRCAFVAKWCEKNDELFGMS